MANMSYCRFNNTLMDVDDCIEALIERKISSEDEKRKAKWLLKHILNFCQDEGIIEEYNSDKIEKIIKECK